MKYQQLLSWFVKAISSPIQPTYTNIPLRPFLLLDYEVSELSVSGKHSINLDTSPSELPHPTIS